MSNFDIEQIDHLATDGLSPLLKDSIENMTDEQYDQWRSYHMQSCKEESILGMSNHGLYICR